MTGDYGPNSCEVPIGGSQQVRQCGIESDGLSGGRFVHEEAEADAICNRLHQERRDAVPDPRTAVVANFPECVSGDLQVPACQ